MASKLLAACLKFLKLSVAIVKQNNHLTSHLAIFRTLSTVNTYLSIFVKPDLLFFQKSIHLFTEAHHLHYFLISMLLIAHVLLFAVSFVIVK